MNFIYQRKNTSHSTLPPFHFDPTLEPLLNSDRYELFPIKYPKAWRQYKDQEESVWKADAIVYHSDRSDFITLPKNVQVMLTKTLAFLPMRITWY